MTHASIPLALSLAVLLTGCGGHGNVQVNSVGAPANGATSGASVSIQGRSTFGTLLAIGFLAGVSYEGGRDMPRSARPPELDTARRVVEHDCTKPIEDWSANFKCK